MQLSNPPGKNLSGKAVTSESSIYVGILKNEIFGLEKQLSQKNKVIDFLTLQDSCENSRYIKK